MASAGLGSLSLPHKFKQSIHVHSPDTLQIDERMWVRVLLQDFVQYQRGSRQDQFVGLDDLVFTGNAHITEVAFIPMTIEGPCKVLQMLLPFQSEHIFCYAALRLSESVQTPGSCFAQLPQAPSQCVLDLT